jgi:hypothetical protein
MDGLPYDENDPEQNKYLSELGKATTVTLT